MPGLDRTGPNSQGIRTGRGLGRCNNPTTDTVLMPGFANNRCGRHNRRNFNRVNQRQNFFNKSEN